MTFFLCFAMSITRLVHLLTSADHRMERFSKNGPWVIFNKIKSSSMTLSEGNRHSFRICFTSNLSAAKDFLSFTFPSKGLFNPQQALVIPKKGSISPITGFSFPK